MLRPSNGYYTAEGRSLAADAINFQRSPGRVGDIARQRYFAVCVVPVTTMAAFGSGWYPEEADGTTTWRWMTNHGEMWFPAAPQDTLLSLKFSVPRELVAKRPKITLNLNGARVDEFEVNTRLVQQRTWVVHGNTQKPNLVSLEIDRSINLQRERISSDDRDLGLRLLAYSWRPARSR